METTPHRVTWTIDVDGPTGQFHCDATEGAQCRTLCKDEGCQEGWPEEGHKCTPVAQEGCLVKEWVSEQDVIETCGHPRPGVPLRDGPVEVFWEGNGYSWSYADVPPAPWGPVLEAVAAELARQVEKYGVQNLPDVIPDEDPRVNHYEYAAQRAMLHRISKRAAPSWYDVILEEVHELLAETDPHRRREEAIQVAAVAVQMVEAIDANTTDGAT